MPQSHFTKPGRGASRPRVDFTITRSDLAETVHASVGRVSRREARALVDMVFEEISAALLAEGTVKLHTFGTFQIRGKRKRVGRNPRTGVSVPIEPRQVVAFRPSPQMCEAIASGYSEGDRPRMISPEDFDDMALPGGAEPAESEARLKSV